MFEESTRIAVEDIISDISDKYELTTAICQLIRLRKAISELDYHDDFKDYLDNKINDLLIKRQDGFKTSIGVNNEC